MELTTMSKTSKDPNTVSFVRLGTSRPESKERQIEISKFYSKITAEVNAIAKKDTCYLCGKPCSSFCNSHSIPQFMLHSVAQNGKVISYIQKELSPEKNDPGVKSAGTFQLICRSCDNTVFQEYESPDSYSCTPSDKMLAQIALKNYLHMLWKRTNEIEYYRLLPKYFPHSKQMTQVKLYFAERDLRDYRKMYLYAKRALDRNLSGKYYLCFYRELDYIVPYASQAAITLFSDLDDNIVNNIFIESDEYSIECIHVCVFPLETRSVIMAFVEAGNKRYRRFYRQLNKLSLDDQLATLNYIVFSNTENVFVHSSLTKQPQENEVFRDICKMTFDHTYTSMNPNPTAQALHEFGLSRRTQIPNFLSPEYAIK